MNLDLGLFVLRVVVGGVVAAHGLQKFGYLGGRGLKTVGQGFQGMGFRPGYFWATVVALAEAGGGLLTILGLGGPIGPTAIAANIAVAMVVVHWSKGFWITKGGIEFTLSLIAATVALAVIGNGRWSLDSVFGIAFPSWFGPAWSALMAAGLLVALALHFRRRAPAPTA